MARRSHTRGGAAPYLALDDELIARVIAPRLADLGEQPLTESLNVRLLECASAASPTSLDSWTGILIGF